MLSVPVLLHNPELLVRLPETVVPLALVTAMLVPVNVDVPGKITFLPPDKVVVPVPALALPETLRSPVALLARSVTPVPVTLPVPATVKPPVVDWMSVSPVPPLTLPETMTAVSVLKVMPLAVSADTSPIVLPTSVNVNAPPAVPLNTCVLRLVPVACVTAPVIVIN